jgi:hypothetical protein
MPSAFVPSALVPYGSLATHLYRCYLAARHVDVKLTFSTAAEGYEFAILSHKVVLERCKYFEALFSGPLAPPMLKAAAPNFMHEVRVVLDDPNITRDAVDCCLSFLYNDGLIPVKSCASSDGRAHHPALRLVGALAFASVLVCPELERALVEALRVQIEHASVHLVLAVGAKYFQPGLVEAAMRWLCWHVHELERDVLHQLSPSVLAELLARPELHLGANGTVEAYEMGTGSGAGCGVSSEWARYELVRRYALAPPRPPSPEPPPSFMGADERGGGGGGCVDASAPASPSVSSVADGTPPPSRRAKRSAHAAVAASTRSLSPLEAAERPTRRQRRLDGPDATALFSTASSAVDKWASSASTSTAAASPSPWDEPLPPAAASTFAAAACAPIVSPVVDVSPTLAPVGGSAGRAGAAGGAASASASALASVGGGAAAALVTALEVRLSGAALLPLWEEVRLAQMAPTELLVVQADGLVPAELLLRAYRLSQLLTWEVPSQGSRMSERLQLWRRMPGEWEALRTHTEGRHPLRVPGILGAIRACPLGTSEADIASLPRLPLISLMHQSHQFHVQPQLTVCTGAVTGANPLVPARRGDSYRLSLTIWSCTAEGRRCCYPSPQNEREREQEREQYLQLVRRTRSYDVGVLLLHARGTSGAFDHLPAPERHTEHHRDRGAHAEYSRPRVTVHLKPSLASLEAGGYLLPTGELPFTLLLHEPNRDVPKPLRHHGAKPINGRPTSIQPWQYSKESPPLRHWI